MKIEKDWKRTIWYVYIDMSNLYIVVAFLLISLYKHNPTRIYYSTYSFIGSIGTHADFEICFEIYVSFVWQLFMFYLLIGHQDMNHSHHHQVCSPNENYILSSCLNRYVLVYNSHLYHPSHKICLYVLQLCCVKDRKKIKNVTINYNTAKVGIKHQ